MISFYLQQKRKEKFILDRCSSVMVKLREMKLAAKFQIIILFLIERTPPLQATAILLKN